MAGELLSLLRNKIADNLYYNDAMKARQELEAQGKNPSWDLLNHYYVSKNLADKAPFGYLGDAGVLGLGFGAEVLDGLFTPSTGFSVDDMGANLAGVMGMSLDEASNQNIFNHTESKRTGIGQGDIRKVANKFGVDSDMFSRLGTSLMNTTPVGKLFSGAYNYLTPSKDNVTNGINLPPIIKDYAPIDDKLAWDYKNDPQYFAHPAFGPTKGTSVATLGSGVLNKVSDNTFLDRLATIPQTAVVGLGELAYQFGTDWKDPKKALADAFEQTAGYGISRWRGDDLNTADDMWKAGIKSEQTLENFKNIFNPGTIEVDDKVPYLTRREILAKKKAEQLRLAKVAEQQRLDKITATEQARPTNNWINGVQTQASIDRGNRAVAAAGGSMDDFSDIPRVHNPVVRGNPAPRGTGFEYKGGRPTGPMGYGL